MNDLTPLIEQIRKTDALARSLGIPNINQPGLQKELIIAEMLSHTPITSKHDADAYDENGKKVEYLSSKIGGACQMDAMITSPPEKRAKSIQRVTRNAAFYLIFFDKIETTQVRRIYKVPTKKILKGVEDQMAISPHTKAHIGFSELWAKANGRLIVST